MAGYLTNTLYAPIVNTFMRAFPNDTDATIYFNISPLNDISLIKKVHVSLVDQRTNENALNDITGILIYLFDLTNDDESVASVGYEANSDLYFITIPREALRNDNQEWNINQYYKVQLRLDCTDGGDYADVKEKTAYLQDNILNFSEWSSVCLLRPILQPNIQLRQFDLNQSEYKPTYNKGIIPINGKVFFGDANSIETETLQSFYFEIFPENSNTSVFVSDMVYTGNQLDPNNINYRLDLQGIDTENSFRFNLRITIITKNQYVMSKNYTFTIYDYIEMTDFHPVGINQDEGDPSLLVEVSDEEGLATFRFKNLAALYGIVYVKRSSSISNFKKWETILEQAVSDTIDIKITDNTLNSHTWYRYSIQFENTAGALSQIYYTNTFFPKFYDAFITRLDRQLDLRYDFKISSMRPVVNRAKIDTLGGKYPKFAENAVLNYKQFSITGLISADADYHQMLITKSNHFKDSYIYYRTFLSQEKIEELVRNDSKDWINSTGSFLTTTRDDWLWEREFREEAIAWLNDGEPKLFRSMTEGSMPVMITDISLTPKANLGRMLYEFSATMYQVGESDSLEDLEKLNIIHIPRVQTSLGSGGSTGSTGGIGGGGSGSEDDQPVIDYRELVVVAQAYEFIPTTNNNQITSGEIYNKLMDKYLSGGVYSTKEAYDLFIRDVRVYFHGKPHLYLISENNNIQLILSPTKDQLNSDRVKLGYTLQIQTVGDTEWKTIFVNERGYYQIPRDIDVTGIAFPVYEDTEIGTEGDLVTVEYLLCYKERAAEGTVIVGQTVDRTVVGQYENIFKPNEYLGDTIRNKYNYINGNTSQKMNYWKGISLDVTPYAVASIKYNSMDKYNSYVIGQTGILHMLRDFPVTDMCFLGISMVSQPEERKNYLDEHEYYKTNVSAQTIEEITKPINNHVYNINNKLMIYHQNKWANFTENTDGTGIAAVNVEGAINYLGDVILTQY